jgi:hypothetical protein
VIYQKTLSCLILTSLCLSFRSTLSNRVLQTSSKTSTNNPSTDQTNHHERLFLLSMHRLHLQPPLAKKILLRNAQLRQKPLSHEVLLQRRNSNALHHVSGSRQQRNSTSVASRQWDLLLCWGYDVPGLGELYECAGCGGWYL